MSQPETGAPASPWHGWARVNRALAVSNSTTGPIARALHISPYPGRKSIALSLHEGVTSEPLAYFVSEEAARRALEFLDQLVG